MRRDHVEVLGARRQIEFVDLEQDAAREAQTFVMRSCRRAGIVDETFQPTVVRGFSKYTRITMISRSASFVLCAASRVA